MNTMIRKVKNTSEKLGYGRDGCFNAVNMLVDDPYEQGVKHKARINTKHDVLLHWKARKRIDDAQFIAGQRLQNIWYQTGVGQISTIRYDHERVDTSATGGHFSEHAADAGLELRKIAAFLGQFDFKLLVRIICQGRKIEDEAQDIGGREPQLYVARRVRDALDYLADYWGTRGSLERFCTRQEQMPLS
ncbi:hypothetical protein WJT86_10065 [Microvirga sp. W0021]|uniref:Uncharacterized protein n=1 Tax=Hohaiivirga grylli TaxID=3133970 RepID=A0ABV0BPC8_9HYPH